MHAFRNLVRRLAGALVALTLAMFVVGPSLDALVCHEELSTVVATGEQVATIDDGGTRHPGSSPHQPCVHGHCHHNLQSVLAMVAEAPVSEGGGERQVWPALIRLATLAPTGLERPPRA